ncbi:MAG: rhomboid family intramembrane serine protease [Saprospiraceae bacterium]|nr:rhomboid family intramembrane serine protease [Saprospiraceae bacterium]
MQKEIISFIIKIRYPLFLIALLWIIEAGDYFLHLDLKNLGIYPRELSGLPGIITAPFIHSNWSHLVSNTSPILVLTSIMAVFYRKVAFYAYFSIMVGTGLLVWLFARESYHIGASGMVYGLVSFVFWTGVFKKNIKSIILGLIIVTLYSGLFTNMFPNAEIHISWESHMFGGIIGLVTAFIYKNVIEDDEKEYYVSPWADDNNSLQSFLPADTFEKTKKQRYLAFMEAESNRLQEERNQREREIY